MFYTPGITTPLVCILLNWGSKSVFRRRVPRWYTKCHTGVHRVDDSWARHPRTKHFLRPNRHRNRHTGTRPGGPLKEWSQINLNTTEVQSFIKTVIFIVEHPLPPTRRHDHRLLSHGLSSRLGLKSSLFCAVGRSKTLV